jgi:hypothetical protein
MGTEPQRPTVSEVVRRAIEAVDPGGLDAGLAELERAFEDDDRPISAVADPESLFEEARRERAAADPTGADPGLEVAAAVATYLAFRRDEVDEQREELLRLAIRAEFDGSPPAAVEDWLVAEGIDA